MSFTITEHSKTSYMTAEQQAWLKKAYKTIVRILKKQPTFHVNDFWKATKEPFPADRYTPDARVLGAVFRQVAREGLMVNESPDTARRVYTDGKPTGTFKPVYTSRISK